MDETNTAPASALPIIEVRQLGKRYAVYAHPADRIRELFLRRPCHRELVALQDLTFSVQAGESIGIIGRNGSGKSTLLQLLAGVLTPSDGMSRVSGRIAALLELGAGFNIEYSGIENIYLFGLVHGLARQQVDEILDEVVAFADIGEFIRQPVKTYSSGMFVRLAFACAIHTRPEVFIVDEALAVGDLRFTQKCYRFMRGFVEAGGTLLFVSHDMASVRNMTQRVLWIDQGRLRADGEVRKVTDDYVAWMNYGESDAGGDSGAEAESGIATRQAKDAGILQVPGETQYVYAQGGRLLDYSLSMAARLGELPGIWQGDEEAVFHVRLQTDRPVARPVLGLACQDAKAHTVFHINTALYGKLVSPIAAGEQASLRLRFRLPGLAAGKYSFYLNLVDGDYDENESLCMLTGIAEFEVVPPAHLQRLMGSVLLESIELLDERRA